MAETQQTQTARPETGEQTKKQTQGIAGVQGFWGEAKGFIQPTSGTYQTYRKMRGNPTVALARIAATAPIRVAPWAVEAQDGVPNDRVQFIQEQLESLWPVLVKEMLHGLDYGWQPFEKVWKLDGGRLVYQKLKPLTVEKTVIRIDRETGAFAGLKQANIELEPEKCFVFTYDGEAGNFYGRSRHENIREHAWHPWNELAKKVGQYATKVAGVIPMIEYPEGTSADATGSKKDNFDIAKAVLQNLGTGHGVAMPNTFARHAEDLAKSGVDLAQLKAWHISFLETRGQHGPAFVTMMRHLESLMLRGWLVPERAVVEGQYGTKAEAGEHAKLALTVADLVFQDMIRHVNWYLVNPLLALNFGPESENSVWVSRAGLDPVQQAFFRSIMDKVLTAPPNVDLLLKMLDIDAMIDSVGLPKAAEMIRPEDLEQRESPGGETEEEEGPRKAGPATMAALKRIHGALYGDRDGKKNRASA